VLSRNNRRYRRPAWFQVPGQHFLSKTAGFCFSRGQRLTQHAGLTLKQVENSGFFSAFFAAFWRDGNGCATKTPKVIIIFTKLGFRDMNPTT